MTPSTIKTSKSIRTFRLSALAAVISIGFNGVALAQEQQSPQLAQLEEVLVTGTLIEGSDPVGANIVTLDSEAILETGASDGAELLRRIPQASDFNTLPTPTLTSSISFTPVNLRGLGGLSGMTTLILMDGRRIVPQGFSNWVDASIVPSSFLERVEVMPDGGSSIYGSDAVGGVINFIPRKDLDGGELTASYGAGAGDFDTLNLSGAYGKSWDSGSWIGSFSFGDRSALMGRDLGYFLEDQTSLGGEDFRSTQCANENISQDGEPLVPETRCSLGDDNSLFPEEEKYSVFTNLSQQLSDSVKLGLTAFYTSKETVDYDARDPRTNVDMNSDNPFFSPVLDPAEDAHTVSFNYADVTGFNRANPAEYNSFGITPSLRIDLNDSWVLNTSLNYGASDSEYTDLQLNTAAQSSAVASSDPETALNPYDVSQTNVNVLADILDWRHFTAADQELMEARAVVNGDVGVFQLAVGAEARKEVYTYFQSIGPTGTDVEKSSDLDRRVNSAYFELLTPLMGDEADPTLELSIGGRYDDYDDVGSSANPKISLDFSPTDDMTLRANWSTSFRAPALADLAVSTGYELFLPFSPFRAAESPFSPDFFMPSFTVGGVREGVKPEEAEIFSLGGDFFITENLNMQLTYWNIDYEDRMDQNAGFFFGPQYYEEPASEDFYIVKPETAGEVIDKFGDLPAIGFPSLQAMFDIFGAPYVVSDQRKDNMGAYKVDGIDFSTQYIKDTSYGQFDAQLSGTYILNKEKEVVKGGGLTDTLEQGDFNSAVHPLNFTASVGFRKGPAYVSTTLYHKGSADVGDASIDAYNTVALFASYDMTDDLMFTLNVDNLTDAEPPKRLWARDTFAGRAYINNRRVITAGVNWKF